MKVFLTGAAGFVGSHVTRALLDAGCEVLAFDRPNVSLQRIHDLTDKITMVYGDLNVAADYLPVITKWRPEACIHLAWYAEPGKYLHSPKNVVALTASLTLLQELIEIGCQQVVMAGTCAEYDTEQGFLSETGPTRPATIYAATKLSLSLIGQQIAAAAGINFAWARIFYLYGTYEDERRLVPALIRGLMKGEAFPATPGEQVRDYLYVEDIALAFWTLVSNKASGIYNVSSGDPLTIRRLMETTGEILGCPDLVKYGALPYRDWEPMFICGDNRRLRNLGWTPQYALQDGLKQTIEWWRGRD